MKLMMMNGALTIGTRDGANIEIERAVGADCFPFGLLERQVAELRRAGYAPSRYIAASPLLESAIQLIESGHFSRAEPGTFDELTKSLRQERSDRTAAALECIGGPATPSTRLPRQTPISPPSIRRIAMVALRGRVPAAPRAVASANDAAGQLL